MKDPLVSIVAPCYNGEEYLGRFFNSILNQTYSNLELILINDGSNDRTEEIVRSYQGKFKKRGIHFIYQYQENAGQAAALNRGLKLFKGEYVSCLDSDDVIMPKFVETKVQFLQNNPEYVYCYGKSVAVNESNPDKIVRTYEKRNRSGRYDFFEDIIHFKNVFFSGYMMLSSAFDSMIKEREIYDGPGGQNAQILLPFAWYYGEPGYVEDSIYKYYIRENSHSHSRNTSEKIINQLCNYEEIILQTLDKIGNEKVGEYKIIVKSYYSRLKFGNAIDTKDSKLIRKYYFELKQVGEVKLHDWFLYMKYANRLIYR